MDARLKERVEPAGGMKRDDRDGGLNPAFRLPVELPRPRPPLPLTSFLSRLIVTTVATSPYP